ncbi:hypothetical protein J6590_081394 [Homalodisca vitripennis]|nr:hypothetical protein J6590_081394 [Homalodisca vitripennis]
MTHLSVERRTKSNRAGFGGAFDAKRHRSLSLTAQVYRDTPSHLHGNIWGPIAKRWQSGAALTLDARIVPGALYVRCSIHANLHTSLNKSLNKSNPAQRWKVHFYQIKTNCDFGADASRWFQSHIQSRRGALDYRGGPPGLL